MPSILKSGALVAFTVLAACDFSGFNRQAYPDRSEHAFQSADGVHVISYVCVNGANAASAHAYVDRAILSAERRITGDGGYSQQGFGGGLAAQAGLNAEIARIAREAEADYRCQMLTRKKTSAPSLFGG